MTPSSLASWKQILPGVCRIHFVPAVPLLAVTGEGASDAAERRTLTAKRNERRSVVRLAACRQCATTMLAAPQELRRPHQNLLQAEFCSGGRSGAVSCYLCSPPSSRA